MDKIFYASANLKNHRNTIASLKCGELSVVEHDDAFFHVVPIRAAGNKKKISVLEFGLPQKFPDGLSVVFHSTLDGALSGLQEYISVLRNDDIADLKTIMDKVDFFLKERSFEEIK